MVKFGRFSMHAAVYGGLEQVWMYTYMGGASGRTGNSSNAGFDAIYGKSHAVIQETVVL